MATESQQTASALNPLQTWADLNLRMLDWMVSSSQQAGDRADRMARAGSAVRAQDVASHAAGSANGSALNVASQWQNAGWGWMAQAWRQWFALLGTFNGSMAPPFSTAKGKEPATGATAAVDAVAAVEAAEGSVVSAAPAKARTTRSAAPREAATAARGSERPTASSGRTAAKRGTGRTGRAASSSSKPRASARGKSS